MQGIWEKKNQVIWSCKNIYRIFGRRKTAKIVKNRRRGILGQGLFWWVSKIPNEIMVWWWLNLEELCAGVFSKN
jgi:hypothetical protein